MHITAQGPRLRNDLCCVEWDIKLYYTIPYVWLVGLCRWVIMQKLCMCMHAYFGDGMATLDCECIEHSGRLSSQTRWHVSQLDRCWNYFCDYAVMVWVYRFVILQSTVVCKSFQIERCLVSSLDPSTFAFVLVNKGRWKSLKVLEFISEKSRLLKVVENVRSTFLKYWKSLWIFRLQVYSWSSSLRFKVDDWLPNIF